jgi:hypothetical protein
MVLGIDSSFSLANQIKDLGIYIVYVNPGGSFSDTSNAYFKRFLLHQ